MAINASGLHVLELAKSKGFASLHSGIVLGENERYQLADARPDNWDAVFPHLEELPNTIIDCAARAGGQGNLGSFLHAGIAAAGDYGLF